MDSDGEHANYSGDNAVIEEQLRWVARKKAARHRAPSGKLRLVRRPATLLPAGGGAARWGGRRQRELLLWRERQAREMAARRFNVTVPPDSLVDLVNSEIVIEVDLGNNEIVVHG